MTTVGTVSQSATYAQILAAAQKTTSSSSSTATGTGTSASGNSATSVTLSDAAKAALAQKDFATVTTDARATMDTLLAAAKLSSPLKDGALALDLSKVDRRELYAMSVNAGQLFTADEQKAAAVELQNRFDQALAGPTAVGRVTGSVKGLYTAALAYLDAMSPEEKASATYADQRAAIEQMLKQLDKDPATLPGSVPNDRHRRLHAAPRRRRNRSVARHRLGSLRRPPPLSMRNTPAPAPPSPTIPISTAARWPQSR